MLQHVDTNGNHNSSASASASAKQEKRQLLLTNTARLLFIDPKGGIVRGHLGLQLPEAADIDAMIVAIDDQGIYNNSNNIDDNNNKSIDNSRTVVGATTITPLNKSSKVSSKSSAPPVVVQSVKTSSNIDFCVTAGRTVNVFTSIELPLKSAKFWVQKINQALEMQLNQQQQILSEKKKQQQ